MGGISNMKYLTVARDALIKLANKLRRLIGMEDIMKEQSPAEILRAVLAEVKEQERKLAQSNQAAALAAKRPIADQIIEALVAYGPCTRRYLSAILARDISSLCAALKTLTKQNVVSADATTICSITGKEVTLYDLKEAR
jgi:hypothetical protein